MTAPFALLAGAGLAMAIGFLLVPLTRREAGRLGRARHGDRRASTIARPVCASN